MSVKHFCFLELQLVSDTEEAAVPKYAAATDTVAVFDLNIFYFIYMKRDWAEHRCSVLNVAEVNMAHGSSRSHNSSRTRSLCRKCSNSINFYWYRTPNCAWILLAEFVVPTAGVVTLATMLFWGATWFTGHIMVLVTSALNFLSLMIYTMILITAFNVIKETRILRLSSVTPQLLVHSDATKIPMAPGPQLMMKPIATIGNRHTILDVLFKFRCLHTFWTWLPSWNKAFVCFLIVTNVRIIKTTVTTDTTITKTAKGNEVFLNARLLIVVAVTIVGAFSKKNIRQYAAVNTQPLMMHHRAFCRHKPHCAGLCLLTER